jgi:Mrp family chromosome partitioning ATPase
VLVVNAEHTRRGAAREALDALGRAGANVMGVVINGAREVTLADARPSPTGDANDPRTAPREQAPAGSAR